MTPKEKAAELIKKFDELLPCEGTTTGETPIQCALITVEAIIESIDSLQYSRKSNFWELVKAELKC